MSSTEVGHASQSVMERVGPNIIHHVSNSDILHPLIDIPLLFGINFSVTKHVLMLWIVALLVGVAVVLPVRKFLSSGKSVPNGWMNGIEAIVQFIRDTIVMPNVGKKWVMTWTPFILTFFFFILFANAIGMIPIFDVLGVFNRFVLGVPSSDSHNFINTLLHGGVTATGNFNVTAGLATVTFFAIIVAGTLAHGFLNHVKNLVPSGLAWPVYILLIPIEIMGLFVKPFALTMRLAANMTGGHIALLALLSLMAIFGEMFQSSAAGIGVAFVALPMAAAISGLEIIVVLVQAYVFTLLTSVFVGMAINVHH
ncbi:MAG: F0F1 ATP synthase subunit A [Candidatus Marinimicrobia bacterium]|jgi:F-type H+-transporting ATPase subunit a|nr:F0F1 ATP synthase subunit A [Candidatus Neomarinimicrobiota bacterium]MBT3945370.1 F0F1 ATP synthase subunit A [Candidatus Neomarinimicrobiota bacterium]MBT4154569.1 F0F1 ATP synthase subunit A [Candidatus Neomarinimicrobiota bacterium]MBT4554284.1 F0F1 ATP synthase subunit A [Candidatus Neomarinimicrobiota bacterium]MBT4753456.1 F0F1 ATP synthase subunit A [Candidatus Neomarinimicrobiota bacterium]|tara:strand:- start:6451 stop:7380 length:930 start_codon:yes stop_codon:yes gene_type:complete